MNRLKTTENARRDLRVPSTECIRPARKRAGHREGDTAEGERSKPFVVIVDDVVHLPDRLAAELPEKGAKNLLGVVPSGRLRKLV